MDILAYGFQVNSFGFGGTNAVAILDDAYNYLRLQGLEGYHRTEHHHTNGQAPAQSSSHYQGTSEHRSLEQSMSAGEASAALFPGTRRSIPPTDDRDTLDCVNTPRAGDASEGSHATRQDGDCVEVNFNTTEGFGARPQTKRLLVWSAPEEQGAERLNNAYTRYLSKQRTGHELDNLAHALFVRRSQFPWRSFALVDVHDQADGGKDPLLPISRPTRASGDPRVAFIFTGQGAQYLGMGSELFCYPVFQESLEACERSLSTLGCRWSLSSIIRGSCNEPDINAPELSQPLTTILQIALVDLLQSVGLIPSLVIGHSSGEVAAAYASGALSRESAVKVAYKRGILSSRLAMKGLGMMAVGLSRSSVALYLSRLTRTEKVLQVQIGCVNSPKSVTLSGDVTQLKTLQGWLTADGIFVRFLRVPVAYHSHFMKAVADEYSDSIRDLHPGSGRSAAFVPMISSVTGDVITAEDLVSSEYWVRNLTSPVEFEKAFARFLGHANSGKRRKQLGKRHQADLSRVTHAVEVGPHSALQGPIRDILQGFSGAKPHYVASLVRSDDASVSFLRLLGTLHCAGFAVDLHRANTLGVLPRPMPDMPMYPFNHSQRYWAEGSLSRNFRFRETPRHDLLGTPSLDWNPRMAVWRNVMRIAELPWLEDHKVGANIVVPAAAILAMAIEAHQQLAGQLNVSGIHIRDVSFSHAISFPSGVDKVETQLTLAPTSQTNDAQLWSQFRIFVRENDSYIECSRGWIRAVVDEVQGQSVATNGPWRRSGSLQTWTRRIRRCCLKSISDPYIALKDTDLRYGLTFQNLHSVQVSSEGQVIAKVNTESWKSNGTDWAPRFTVHPTTLDGIVQSCLQAMLAQRGGDLPSMMPVRVARIWIDCTTPSIRVGDLDVTATCMFQGSRGGSADMVAISGHQYRPVVYIESLETAFISSKASKSSSHQQLEAPRRLCMGLSWKPDIDNMSATQLLAYCIRARPRQSPDAVEIYRSQKIAIMCYIEEALSNLDVEGHCGAVLEPHLQSYVAWMRYQQDRFRSSDLESLLIQNSVQRLLKDPEAREKLIEKVESTPGDGFFFVAIGRKLMQMLRGEIDPLDFIFRDGLADRYYQAMLDNDHHAYPASEFVELCSFKSPSMKIIEIGAGTGGQTMRLLQTMGRDGVNKWAHYDYTDISPSFFSHARDKFHAYLDSMRFRVCDISQDPIKQGFDSDYDLVIASHVLHATDSLQNTLLHIRKLLKPGGKFLLFETTRPEAVPIGFAFGLLKGWWSPLDHEPEARAPHSPCVTVDKWDTLLKETGFTGVDVEIPGQGEPYCQTASIMISTAVARITGYPSKPSRQVYIVVDGKTQVQDECGVSLLALFPEEFATSVKICTITELAEAEISESSLAIFVVEMCTEFLSAMTEADYQSLQSILLQTKNILWVAKSAKLGSVEPQPGLHLAYGLGRSWMSEDSIRKFTHLALEKGNPDLAQEVRIIYNLSQSILELPVESVENNYIVVQGRLEICRVSEGTTMDTKVSNAIRSREIRDVQLSAPDTHIALHISPGHLETLEWLETDEDDVTRDECSLKPDEVDVDVRAVGLTFRDHLIAKGDIDAIDMGTECAGIIRLAGSQSGFQPGDRVCLISTCTARSVVRVPMGFVVAIPPQMSLDEAASIPTAQWLAYHALVNIIRVRKGDTVLVHQGTSCTGQMAIQLARNWGARVLVTTSSVARARFLIDKLSVPEASIFTTEGTGVIAKIYEATNGDGVDVIVGAISGTELELSACLATCGRVVDTTLLSPAHCNSEPSIKELPANNTISSVNLINLIHSKPTLAANIFQDAMKMAFDQCLEPPQPLQSFSAHQVKDALVHFQDRESLGKKVLVLDSRTPVSVSLQHWLN